MPGDHRMMDTGRDNGAAENKNENSKFTWLRQSFMEDGPASFACGTLTLGP
jgi:hypothetical protein